MSSLRACALLATVHLWEVYDAVSVKWASHGRRFEASLNGVWPGCPAGDGVLPPSPEHHPSREGSLLGHLVLRASAKPQAIAEEQTHLFRMC